MSTAGTDQNVERIADAVRKNATDSRFMGKAGRRGRTIYGIDQEMTFAMGLGLVVDGKMVPALAVPVPTEHWENLSGPPMWQAPAA